jgi:hypothetical protein
MCRSKSRGVERSKEKRAGRHRKVGMAGEASALFTAICFNRPRAAGTLAVVTFSKLMISASVPKIQKTRQLSPK